MEMVATAPAQMGPGEIGDWAARAERIGYDTIHISETIHDSYDDIGGVLTEWYSGLCTGMTLQLPADEDHDEQLAVLVDRCRQIPTGGIA